MSISMRLSSPSPPSNPSARQGGEGVSISIISSMLLDAESDGLIARDDPANSLSGLGTGGMEAGAAGGLRWYVNEWKGWVWDGEDTIPPPAGTK
jgi:hypothetical protein